MGDTAVENVKHRVGLPEGDLYPVRTYGTLWCGLETMSEAWKTLEHRFSVGTSATHAGYGYTSGNRPPLGLLNEHPVDVLVVEQGHVTDAPPVSCDITRQWREMVRCSLQPPIFVIESWLEKAVLWENGPSTKGSTQRWTDRGYATRTKRVCASEVGGAIIQSRIMVVRVKLGNEHAWVWPPTDTETRPRPMSNLLLPVGLTPED